MADARVAAGQAIAASDELIDGGQGVRFEIATADDRVAAFAVRWRGSVHAFVNVCPHQESQLDWLPGAFFDMEGRYLVCATHGALFEPDTGRCVDGPCAGAFLTPLRTREIERCVVFEGTSEA